MTMRILVAFASKHGATRELASQIGKALSASMFEHGIYADIDVIDASDVDSVADYDAVVLGSAVYFGRWLRPARRLVSRHIDSLHTRPVWLFSSGPVDSERPAPNKQPDWARGHHLFGGRLDFSVLSRTERMIARLVRATSGDGRSPTDIARWAGEIGDALAGQSQLSTHTAVPPQDVRRAQRDNRP